MSFANCLLIDLLGRRKDNYGWRGSKPPLDLGAVQDVCVLHHNHKAGDALLISLLVDALAQSRPQLKLRIACSAAFASYWEQHPGVSEVIVLDAGRGRSGVARVLHTARVSLAWRRRLDVVVSFAPFARVETFALLRCLAPRTLVGFGKDTYRLFDYSLEEHRHGVDLAPIADRTRSVMRLFGQDVDVRSLRAHVPFTVAEASAVRERLADLPGPYLLLNTYGATPFKRMAPETVRRLIETLRRGGHMGTIVVSVPEGSEAEFRFSVEENVLVLGPQGGLSSLFALVQSMDFVVSPDSAVGHVAAAFGKPQLCLFGHGGAGTKVWRPLSDRCVTLVPQPGEGINDFGSADLRQAVETMLAMAECPPMVLDAVGV